MLVPQTTHQFNPQERSNVANNLYRHQQLAIVPHNLKNACK